MRVLNSNSLSSPTKCICLWTPVHFHIQWCKPAWIPVSSRLKLFWTDIKKNKMYPSESVTPETTVSFLFSPLPKALCWTWHRFFYEKPQPQDWGKDINFRKYWSSLTCRTSGRRAAQYLKCSSSQKRKTLRKVWLERMSKVSPAFSPLPNSFRLQLIFLSAN